MRRTGRTPGRLLFDLFTVKEILSIIEEKPGIGLRELCRSLKERGMSGNPDTAQRYLRFLAWNGCIERQKPHPQLVRIFVTEKGKKLLEGLKQLEVPPPEALEPKHIPKHVA